jgi:hypothetical protein
MPLLGGGKNKASMIGRSGAFLRGPISSLRVRDNADTEDTLNKLQAR